jgi:hypothetical protein
MLLFRGGDRRQTQFCEGLRTGKGGCFEQEKKKDKKLQRLNIPLEIMSGTLVVSVGQRRRRTSSQRGTNLPTTSSPQNLDIEHRVTTCSFLVGHEQKCNKLLL